MVISLSSLGTSLLYLVVAGLILWLFYWAIEKVGLPEPFAKIARVVLIVVTVIVALNFILGFFGHPFVQLR